VHDSTVDGTAQKSQKGQIGILTPKWPFWLLSPHFKMLHEYFLYELTIGVIMKGKGKEKEKQKVHVLTRIQILVSTFHSKKALDGGCKQ
jgi:hypothetical protein